MSCTHRFSAVPPLSEKRGERTTLGATALRCRRILDSWSPRIETFTRFGDGDPTLAATKPLAVARHHTAPKLELNAARYIKVEASYMVQYPATFSWREIEQTNAWKDGVAADYVLHCELVDNPPRR